jgi:ribosome maturation factor RimP
MFPLSVYKRTTLVKDVIEELLTKKFNEPDFQDCFLIEVVDNKKRKIQVFIDKDDGVGFETCRLISRYLEGHLDDDARIRDDYILEVSSPGVDRPLQHPRQYPRNIGRRLSFIDRTGKQIEGTLSAVDDEGIELTSVGKEKRTLKYRFEDMDNVKVIISFK